MLQCWLRKINCNRSRHKHYEILFLCYVKNQCLFTIRKRSSYIDILLTCNSEILEKVTSLHGFNHLSKRSLLHYLNPSKPLITSQANGKLFSTFSLFSLFCIQLDAIANCIQLGRIIESKKEAKSISLNI